MSLICKKHVILPDFKLAETAIYQNMETQQSTAKQTFKTTRRLTTQTQYQSNREKLQTEENQIQSPKVLKRQLPILSQRIQRDGDQLFYDYLSHIKQLSTRKQSKPLIKKFIKMEQEQTQIQTQTHIRRKEAKDKTHKKASISEPRQTPKDQIDFSKQIYNLNHLLHKLKDYLNNSRKLFQVVKSLIGVRKQLRKILLNPNEEDLNDFQEIAKQCQIKETTIVDGNSFVVEKFDISLKDDIQFIIEGIENMLLQTQLQGIKQISQNIKQEENDIRQLRKEMGKFNQQSQPLSIGTIAMQRYQPHIELTSIEKRLGQLQHVHRSLRQTSEVLGQTINRLFES
ncbi:hypothetical protein pb186bvf_000502 [Paramecium bursaria]